MEKIKKLLALGLCLCMAAGITVGGGNSKSSKNSTCLLYTSRCV